MFSSHGVRVSLCSVKARQSINTVFVPTLPPQVTLVWTDPAASPTTAHKLALVNDLDLEVIDPDGITTLGNQHYNLPKDVLDQNGRDRVNNVEVVYLTVARTGQYTINVFAEHVPVPAQTYALVVNYLTETDAVSCDAPPSWTGTLIRSADNSAPSPPLMLQVVAFKTRFESLNLDMMTASEQDSFKSAYKKDIASLLNGVEQEDVIINQLLPGSIIVDSKVYFHDSEAAIVFEQNAVEGVKVFSDKFVQVYGNFTIDEVVRQMVPPLPPLPSAPIDTSVGGSVCTSFMRTCLVVFLMSIWVALDM